MALAQAHRAVLHSLRQAERENDSSLTVQGLLQVWTHPNLPPATLYPSTLLFILPRCSPTSSRHHLVCFLSGSPKPFWCGALSVINQGGTRFVVPLCRPKKWDISSHKSILHNRTGHIWDSGVPEYLCPCLSYQITVAPLSTRTYAHKLCRRGSVLRSKNTDDGPALMVISFPAPPHHSCLDEGCTSCYRDLFRRMQNMGSTLSTAVCALYVTA